MLDKAEVAVVPGEAFGTPGYFRLSYALGDDDLVTGVTRLGEFLATAQRLTPPGCSIMRLRAPLHAAKVPVSDCSAHALAPLRGTSGAAMLGLAVAVQ